MKYLFLIIVATSIIACNTADTKVNGSKVPTDSTGVGFDSANGGSTDASTKPQVDAANLSSIQWLDSTYKDLGKVKEGQVVEVTYHFRNSGNKNLIISSVSASCGCTVPEKPERPFAPGEEGVIKAKFDSKGRKGEARKAVFVEANTPEQHFELNFHVDVVE